jgi:hypothetical protein
MASIYRYETSYCRQFKSALHELQILKARRRERESGEAASGSEITEASATWVPGPFPDQKS